MGVNGFTGQMGWDGMGLLANRVGLGWNGLIFSGLSPTPSAPQIRLLVLTQPIRAVLTQT